MVQRGLFGLCIDSGLTDCGHESHVYSWSCFRVFTSSVSPSFPCKEARTMVMVEIRLLQRRTVRLPLALVAVLFFSHMNSYWTGKKEGKGYKTDSLCDPGIYGLQGRGREE